jgi:hypothetical protein
MTIRVTELINQLQKYNEEIGCDTEVIASHNIKSSVNFVITNSDLDIELELDYSEYPLGLEVNLRPGCLCADGVTFNLKVVK